MKENSTTGRRYDREFKQNAVEWVRAGRTVSRVARDLGVSTWSLGRWVQAANGGQAQSEPKTLAAESDEQRELRRLRQEVDYLREQRDILKKSAQASCQRRCQGALHADGSDAKGAFPACLGAGPGGVGQRVSRPSAEGPGPAPPGRSGVEPCHRTGLHRESADRRPPALSRRRCAKRASGGGKNRVTRLMREHALHPGQKRRWRPQTTQGNHAHPVAENWLAQVPAPERPDQVWVADLTYVDTGEGWLLPGGPARRLFAPLRGLADGHDAGGCAGHPGLAKGRAGPRSRPRTAAPFGSRRAVRQRGNESPVGRTRSHRVDEPAGATATTTP